MGKRRHNDMDDRQYIDYKMRKLERKLKRRKRRRNRRDSGHDSTPPRLDSNRNSPITVEEGQRIEFEPKVQEDPRQCAMDSCTMPSTSSATPAEISESADPATEPAPLDTAILEILGADPSIKKKYGKDVQGDLAVRLQHIATTGLTKEVRKELLERYLVPANCTLIDAPTLNPEIRSAISEVVLKRDKGIEEKQKQLAGAVSCIGEALTSLLDTNHKDSMSLIKLLMDAARLTSDCINCDSVVRRNFVLSNVNKETRDQLQKAPVDNMLFGKDLPEALKIAKSIARTSADLRTVPPKTPQQPSKTRPPSRPLNWKAPPPSRRPRGAQRGGHREPARRNQPYNSSRTSSNPVPRYRRQ